MITFKFLRFPFEVCIPHTVNELVTDIILNNTSQEHLMMTLLHIGSRLFELFSKEVRVKKQPGRPLRTIIQILSLAHHRFHRAFIGLKFNHLQISFIKQPNLSKERMNCLLSQPVYCIMWLPILVRNDIQQNFKLGTIIVRKARKA